MKRINQTSVRNQKWMRWVFFVARLRELCCKLTYDTAFPQVIRLDREREQALSALRFIRTVAL